MGNVRVSGRAAALGGYIYHVGGAGHNTPGYPYLNTTLRCDQLGKIRYLSPQSGGLLKRIEPTADRHPGSIFRHPLS
jgi:hypothetical protein